jgi:hypothetical protein
MDAMSDESRPPDSRTPHPTYATQPNSQIDQISQIDPGNSATPTTIILACVISRRLTAVMSVDRISFKSGALLGSASPAAQS